MGDRNPFERPASVPEEESAPANLFEAPRELDPPMVSVLSGTRATHLHPEGRPPEYDMSRTELRAHQAYQRRRAIEESPLGHVMRIEKADREYGVPGWREYVRKLNDAGQTIEPELLRFYSARADRIMAQPSKAEIRDTRIEYAWQKKTRSPGQRMLAGGRVAAQVLGAPLSGLTGGAFDPARHGDPRLNSIAWDVAPAGLQKPLQLLQAGGHLAGAIYPIGAIQNKLGPMVLQRLVGSGKITKAKIQAARSLTSSLSLSIYSGGGALIQGHDVGEAAATGAAFGLFAPAAAAFLRRGLKRIGMIADSAQREAAAEAFAWAVTDVGIQATKKGLSQIGYEEVAFSAILGGVMGGVRGAQLARAGVDAQPEATGLGVREARGRRRAEPERPEGLRTVEVELPPRDVEPVKIGPRRAEFVEPKEAPDAVQEAQAPQAAEAKPAEARSERTEAQESFSLKNRVVDRERHLRGAGPLAETVRRGWDVTMDRALAKLNANKELPESLLKKALEQGELLGPDERAVLLLHKVDLYKARKAADAEGWKASERGNESGVETARVEVARIEDRIDMLDKAVRSDISEKARDLNFQKAFVREDGSVENMRDTMRREKGYKRLNENEAKAVDEMAARMKEVNEEFDLYTADRPARTVDQVVREVRAQKVPRRTSKKFGANNKLVTREAKEEARANFKAAMAGRLGAGPQDVLGKGLEWAVKTGMYYVEGGIRNFATFSKALVADLGKDVKPHLRAIWDESRRRMSGHLKADAEAKIRTGLERGLDITEMQPQIRRLAEEIARTSGEDLSKPASGKLRDLVNAEVHEVLRKFEPSITLPETIDAIGGYGRFRQVRTVDEAKARIREIEAQDRRLSQIADMRAGKAPMRHSKLRKALPSEARQELDRKFNELRRKGGFTAEDPETQIGSFLDAAKKRGRKQIAELERKIREEDFESPAAPRKIEADPELARIVGRREELYRQWAEMRLRARWESLPLLDKVWEGTKEATNLARAIMTSADLSAVLRQGAMLGLSHPVLARRATEAMFKALVSPSGQARVEAEIKQNPMYLLATREGRLELTDMGGELTRREEVYQSRLAEKMPEWLLVPASQRAYVTYLNKLRMDVFETMARTLSKTGKPTTKEARAIAHFINVASGRGSFGKNVNLTQVLFSPRLLASRFQLMVAQPLLSRQNTWRTRKLIAREYARSLIGVGTMYAFATAMGLKTPFNDSDARDPANSDFGKIRLGPSRIDPLGGLAQVSVFSGRSIDSVFFDGEHGDFVKRFLRYKMAPVPSAVWSSLEKRDPMNQPTGVGREALGLVTPLVVEDIVDAFEEQGVPEATALTLLALFGMGVNTYQKKGTWR